MNEMKAEGYEGRFSYRRVQNDETGSAGSRSWRERSIIKTFRSETGRVAHESRIRYRLVTSAVLAASYESTDWPI